VYISIDIVFDFFANIVPFLNDDYQNCNAHLEFSHLNCFYLGLLFYHQWSLILNPEFLFQKGSSVSYRVVMKVFFVTAALILNSGMTEITRQYTFFVVNGN